MAKQAKKTAPTKRAFMSDLSIQFNLMEMVGTLHTPKKPNAGKEETFKVVCPTCALKKNAVPMEQRYVCTEHDHGLVEPADTERARELDDKTLVLVDKEAIKEAKAATSLPDKKLNLMAHDANEVLPFLISTGNSYVFTPSSADSTFYAILLRLVGDDGFVKADSGPKVLMGEMVSRKSEILVQLKKWNGQLVLSEMARPEDVDTFEPMAPEVDDNLVVLVNTLVDADSTPFVPDQYRATVRERYAELVANPGVTISTPKPSMSSTADLTAALKAAIAAKS